MRKLFARRHAELQQTCTIRKSCFRDGHQVQVFSTGVAHHYLVRVFREGLEGAGAAVIVEV